MTTQRRRFLQAVTAGTAVGLTGCAGAAPGSTRTDGSVTATRAGGDGRIGDDELVLATTTSTWDTGLLKAIHPAFERQYGLTVKAIPKGTGASIRTARDGDADAILVHARGAEDQFLRDGVGVNRRDVMFNDFVIVGPEGDPAGIEGMESAAGAFETIANAEATFLSRGDDSGTHKKEQAIWAEAGVEPAGNWYREIGKGMGDTLVQSSQTDAYTLADRGTFRSMRTEIDLVVHVQGPLKGGPVLLKNPYGVIAVNPAVHSNVNYQAAMAYVGFLTSPQGQSMIQHYTANGSQLFFPNALTEDPDFAEYVPRDYGGGGSASRSRGDLRYRHGVETLVPRDY
ncbi:MAG: substrate-binding domain-containing protein [Halobacteriales archaeon]|nr:substrate-binding domain-containing protein [Halobacteriales archaeon]